MNTRSEIERNMERTGSINEGKVSRTIFSQGKEKILFSFYRRHSIFPEKNQFSSICFLILIINAVEQFLIALNIIVKTIQLCCAHQIFLQLNRHRYTVI